ncbi:cyclic AMP-dependent transcription factor ATF-3-like [Dreissena polymorpha]|uniref:cyclic AMP-dependent transcription factor ATF-3-like n=1 Tax=Dreissena polymorpha TaxID=45954 RepID=UPI002264F21A|nr:cyclic AMP-dependent transcription factor ATF-3-like [Dreissena polymorpha]
MWSSNTAEDLRFQQALLTSLRTGEIMPLLKEELKYCIQSRRLSEGKTELVLETEENHNTQELRTEELEKIDRRKEQNRRASAKFRNRKKSELDDLTKTCEVLQRKNAELQDIVAKLEAERDTLYAEVVRILMGPACVLVQ